MEKNEIINLSRKEEKLDNDCKHVLDFTIAYLTSPEQYRCKKCGKSYTIMSAYSNKEQDIR